MSGSAPSPAGLEFTADANCLHFTTGGRLHASADPACLHFVAEQEDRP